MVDDDDMIFIWGIGKLYGKLHSRGRGVHCFSLIDKTYELEVWYADLDKLKEVSLARDTNANIAK